MHKLLQRRSTAARAYPYLLSIFSLLPILFDPAPASADLAYRDFEELLFHRSVSAHYDECRRANAELLLTDAELHLLCLQSLRENFCSAEVLAQPLLPSFHLHFCDDLRERIAELEACEAELQAAQPAAVAPLPAIIPQPLPDK